MQELQALCAQFDLHNAQAGDIAAWPIEASNEAICTGSAPVVKTIGIVPVAAFAASAAAVPTGVTITATDGRISSAASSASRSLSVLPYRYSMATF